MSEKPSSVHILELRPHGRWIDMASRLEPKVAKFSTHVEITTLRTGLFIQQVEFPIDVIQFHTFAIEIWTKTRRVSKSLDKNF